MGSSKASSVSFLLILLCITSISYFHPAILDENKSSIIPEIEGYSQSSNVNSPANSDVDSSPRIKRIQTPGSPKLRGFFSQNNFIDIDPDGDIIEWVNYDEIKDIGWDGPADKVYRIDSNYHSNPDLWPEQNDTYYYLKDKNPPYPVSAMFSPVFEEETYIEGKVHIMTYLMTDFSSGQGTQDVTFRIKLFLFNTTDSSTSEIFNITDDTIPEQMSRQQRTYDSTLSSPVTIPAGFRLKVVYEAKLSTLERTGRMDVYGGSDDSSSLFWTIDDGEYSNSYTIVDTGNLLGVQFKMFDQTYPDIVVSGFNNNTVYQESNTISIELSGADNSSYRWDSDSFIYFDTSTTTSLPTSMGWHSLEIQALDEFENNRTEIYEIGYDESEINIILDTPTNNSLIGEGDTLYFTPYSIDYATYEWDSSGAQNLTVLNYELIAPDYSGFHNLTIITYDYFEVESFFYVFEFDNTPPLVVLENVVNNTIQPAGRRIDVNVTDRSGVAQVYYKWDSQVNFTWYPFQGNIYRTYLLGSIGEHWLYVAANDSFGNSISLKFNFTADVNLHFVELRNVNNDSYYQGGNTVEITILDINDTIKFYWNNGTELDGEAYYFNNVLTLNESNVLPVSPIGVHNLTIRTFDSLDVEHIYVFFFTLDQENPEILTSKDSYDNKRFSDTDVLTFTFDDNFTSSVDLEVLISINGESNQTLTSPYELILLSFSDGTYNLTLYVFDIAGNFATETYIITVDTTSPSIDIANIEGLVEILGVSYIPTNSTVTISIIDDDPLLNSTYSWGGSVYYSFTNSFILDYLDGASTLYVNATDSLGNENLITIILTIDSLEPSSTLIFPFINSKINNDTMLSFLAEDLSINTIKKIEYYWDVFPGLKGTATLNQYGEFIFSGGTILTLYANGSIAILSIYAEDIVGNNHTYVFNFIIDLYPPEFDVLLFDEDVVQWQIIDTIEEYTVRGDAQIWCTNISSDWSSVIYYWDSEADRPINQTTWIIYAPTSDGSHNLTIIAIDDTGELTSPNQIILQFAFVVDDLEIEVVSPTNLLDQTHQLVYKDQFTFIIKIYDKKDNTSFSDLIWHNESLNNNLDLLILNNTIDNRTLEFTIYATNIGSTSLSFEFSRAGFNIHSVVVDLLVYKKEGSLEIIESDTEAFYGENVSVEVNLQDELSTNLGITAIYVDNISVDFQDLGSFIYAFEITYEFYSGRGNYNLQIRVESTYYFGETNDTLVFEFEIKPLPLILTLETSSYEIITGSAVEIIGTLTYQNGTPVHDVQISFFVYIYYKDVPSNVYAAITGYDLSISINDTTDSNGIASVTFTMTEEIEQIRIYATFEGDQFLDVASFELGDFVISIPPPGIETWLLLTIIGGVVLLAVIASVVVYRLTKKKPFEIYLSKIPDQDITMKLTELCQGAILSIFDQKKGAIPLVVEHSLQYDYGNRLALEAENFVLQVGDQAFSSLGFEKTMKGRRLGSLTLPNESMLGYIHGIQLENKMARGGYENLVLTVLTDLEFGTLLMAYQEFLHHEIDELISMLVKKKPLYEVREQLVTIRRQTTKIILAAMLSQGT